MPTPNQVDGSRFIKDNSIPGAKLTAGALSTVLSSKLLAQYNVVFSFSFTAGSAMTVTSVVQASATTFTPQTSLAALGVYTGAVSGANDPKRVMIRLAGTDEQVNDGTGGDVHGVLTESAGVYTLTLYNELNAVYTLPSTTSIDFYYVEIYNFQTVPVDAFLRDSMGGAVDVADSTAIAAAAAIVPANYTPTTQTLAGQLMGIDTGLAAAGLAHKAVVASATANVPGTYANGVGGIGATITATGNGAFPSQDGVAVALNQRVLLPFQTTAANSGVYTLTQVGTVGTPYILTRAFDFNTPQNMQTGALIPVATGGTLYGNVIFKLETSPTTVGTTALTLDTVQVVPTFLDSQFNVENSSDVTKKWKKDASGVATGQTRTSFAADRNTSDDNITSESSDVITLNSGQVTAKAVTLAGTPKVAANTKLNVDGGIPQRYGLDYSVSGAVLSWGALGLDGTLVVGDIIRVNYLVNG